MSVCYNYSGGGGIQLIVTSERQERERENERFIRVVSSMAW